MPEACNKEAERAQALKAAEAALNQATTEIYALRGKLREAEERLFTIQNSRSWRVLGLLRNFRTQHPSASRLVTVVARIIALIVLIPFNKLGSKNAFQNVIVPIVRQRATYQVSGIDRPGPASEGHSGQYLICVSHVAPFPSRAGNEYRIHRMLKWLERSGYETILVIAPLPNEEPDEEELNALAGEYSNLVVAYRDGRVLCRIRDNYAPLAGLNGKQCGHVSVRPQPAVRGRLLATERTFAHDVLVGVTRLLVEELTPIAIIVNYVFMSRALAVLQNGLLKIIDTHDVFSSKHNKVERYGISDSLTLSEQEEAYLLNRADLIIAIQSGEQSELKRLVPDKQVITAGVDFETAATPRHTPVLPTILMIASVNATNVQGVNDFIKFAWPIIKETIPGVVFRIAGTIGSKIDILDRQVELLGYVGNVAPLYRAAKVAINPSIAGTGLKIKTIEALCHGCPIVVWPAGIDGLPSEAKRLCDVVENWYSFAQAVIVHLKSSEPALQEQQYSALARLFSPEHVYSELATALQMAAAQLGTP